MITLFIFHEKNTSWACLDGSGLKDIFHLLAQKLILSRSIFSFCRVLIGSGTNENIEVSSAKSFTLDSRLSDKLLVYTKKGLPIEPWVTPALTVSHSDSGPFRTTLCYLRIKKIQSKLEDHPLQPYILSYK